MPALLSAPAGPLHGAVRLPGDKSISHRALMLGAMAIGTSRIEGLLEGEDVRATALALTRCGVGIERHGAGRWSVHGVGTGGLAPPGDVLDLGNSGTSARLLCGLLASHDMTAILTGDESLRRRPMGRVIEPLGRIGARFATAPGGRLPLAISGARQPLPIDYATPVASAQLKSAILLAALNTPGRTIVREATATRDHSERLLAAMGADMVCEDQPDGGRMIALAGEAELRALAIRVPGDISSAAFPAVMAAILPGSDILLEGVGLNPLRSGILDALAEMGARLSIANRREDGGEPVGDVRVSAADGLAAITPDPAKASSMIDEFPVLFIAAACARGVSRFRGLGELRVKESDRLATMARGLAACGVRVRDLPDGLEIEGDGHPPAGGARVATELDHRIAMSFLVLGGAAREAIMIDDAAPIATSFPGFVELMNGLGASIAPG